MPEQLPRLAMATVASLFLSQIGAVEQVHFFVRRGPFDLPCTTRELRELVRLPVHKNDPSEYIRVQTSGLVSPLSQLSDYEKLQKSRKLSDRKQKRLLKVLADAEVAQNRKVGKGIHFHFYTTPVHIFHGDRNISVKCQHKTTDKSSVGSEIALAY